MTQQPADSDTLQCAFKNAGIARIAILDDGYDSPLSSDLEEQDWLAAKEAIEDAIGEGSLRALVPLDIAELPTFGDLRDGVVEQLWSYHSRLELGTPSPDKAPMDVSLTTLFRSFSGRKLAKLRELEAVERMAEAITGTKPDVFPSGTAARKLVEYDLVFLDFFLGEETVGGVVSGDMLSAARAKAIRIVQEAISHTDGKSSPLFVLISSRASVDDLPTMRDEAELLASKLRFLSKNEIRNDSSKTQYVLAGLANQRATGDAVERLLREWDRSIIDAKAEMMVSVRRLDIADYAYLRNYRLADEKISVLEYLTWLFNSYLGALVERRLASTDSAMIAPLEADGLPPAILQPMSEIPRIYSDVTISGVQQYGSSEIVKVWTGDLFVRKSFRKLPDSQSSKSEVIEESVLPTDSASQVKPGPSSDNPGSNAPNSPAIPDALVVITPVCDLVPGRIKAKSIALIGGTLAALGNNKVPSNHLLVIDRPGRAAGAKAPSFHAIWDEKWPVSYPLSTFDGAGIAGTDYVRIGRLRDLYAAELAHRFSGDIGRVGVPIAPPFTHALDVRCLVKSGGKIKRLFDAEASAGLAWELFATKDGPKREMVFSEQLLWKLQSEAAKCPGDGDAEWQVLLRQLDILQKLTTPFKVVDKGATPTLAGSKVLVMRCTEMPAKNEVSSQAAVIVLIAAGPLGKDKG